MSLIVLLHGHLSDYAQTGDEDLEEEGKPVVESYSEDGVAEQGSVDKLDLLHALEEIHQDMIWGVKGPINIVEVMDISKLAAELFILGSVTVVTSMSSAALLMSKGLLRRHRFPRNLKLSALL